MQSLKGELIVKQLANFIRVVQTLQREVFLIDMNLIRDTIRTVLCREILIVLI